MAKIGDGWTSDSAISVWPSFITGSQSTFKAPRSSGVTICTITNFTRLIAICLLAKNFLMVQT